MMNIYLNTDNFERRNKCPWCRSKNFKIVAHLQFNVAYHAPKLRFILDDAIIRQRKIARCLNCGLYYNLCIPTWDILLQMLQRGGDEVAPKFSYRWNFNSNRNAYKYSHLLQNLIPQSSASILDVGCYKGQFLSLLPQCWQLCGLEPDPDVANLTSKKFNVKQGFIEFCSPPWPQNLFDAITLFDVAEHIRDLQKAFSNIYLLLKPGGWLLIETGNIASIEAKITKSLWWYFNLFEHFVFWNPDSTTNILTNAGFKIHQIKPVFHVNPKTVKKIKAIKGYGLTALVWAVTLGGVNAALYRQLANIFHKSGSLPTLHSKNHMFILAQKI